MDVGMLHPPSHPTDSYPCKGLTGPPSPLWLHPQSFAMTAPSRARHGDPCMANPSENI